MFNKKKVDADTSWRPFTKNLSEIVVQKFKLIYYSNFYGIVKCCDL